MANRPVYVVQYKSDWGWYPYAISEGGSYSGARAKLRESREEFARWSINKSLSRRAVERHFRIHRYFPE